MKKGVTFFVFICLLVFGVSACGRENVSDPSEGKKASAENPKTTDRSSEESEQTSEQTEASVSAEEHSGQTDIQKPVKKIGEKEQLDLFTMECLETAAVLHDIGIKISEEKYQSSAGKYQELEGPPVAAVILKKLEFPAPVTERVAYLIGHHHTYDKIEGMDYQILVEADFLVNINEDGLDSSKQGLDSIRKIKENIFKTKTGTKILESIYLSKVN